MDNHWRGDGNGQSSETRSDDGAVEVSAEGPDAEELKRDEHYYPDFTDIEMSIPYTWLLNGA